MLELIFSTILSLPSSMKLKVWWANASVRLTMVTARLNTFIHSITIRVRHPILVRGSLRPVLSMSMLLVLKSLEQLKVVLSLISTSHFCQNSVMQCIIVCPQLVKFQLGQRPLHELNTLCHSMVISLVNTVRVEAACQLIKCIGC